MGLAKRWQGIEEANELLEPDAKLLAAKKFLSQIGKEDQLHLANFLFSMLCKDRGVDIPGDFASISLDAMSVLKERKNPMLCTI